jgi:hypothetical protein
MTQLRLKTEFKSLEMQSAVLPVEVRKRNYALVGTGLAPGVIDVPPGSYSIVARMPGGQELRSDVTIADEGRETEVTLRPEPDMEGVDERFEQLVFMTGLSGSARTRGEDEGPPLTLEWYCWEPTASAYRPVVLPLAGSPRGIIRVEGNPTEGTLLLQVHQPDGSFQHTVLPAAKGQQTIKVTVAWRRPNPTVATDRGWWDVDVQLASPTADLVLRELIAGRLASAATVANSATTLYGVTRSPGDSRDLESLLKDKLGDPVGAAIGAYALLRLGELDRLNNWTENLRDWFSWLPDGAAIYGEHLARLGNHEEAAAAFLDLPHRGLPLFVDGLSFALGRLQLYSELSQSLFPPALKTRIVAAAARLQQATRHVDFSRMLTTFAGPSPNVLNGA